MEMFNSFATSSTESLNFVIILMAVFMIPLDNPCDNPCDNHLSFP